MNVNGRNQIRVDAAEATLQNAASGTGNGTVVNLDPLTHELYVWAQGASTPSMTVVFEWSPDGGATWYNAYVQDLLNTALSLVTTLVITDATAYRYRWVPPAGCNRFRARVSALVTGTVTVKATERRWA